MGNRPVIVIAATNLPPQEEERYYKWVEEGYYPLILKSPWATGFDRYRIVNESPDYPKTVRIRHFTDMDGFDNTERSPEWDSIRKDQVIWHREVIWQGIYEMVKSFSYGSFISDVKQISVVDDAPILNLAAFNLDHENAEKYFTWLIELGQRVYVPILMKVAGLKAMKFYRWTGRVGEQEIKEPGYPRYVSLIYFDSLKSYEGYAESPELVAFREALKIPFPGGLDYKWNVQYELTRSWRK